jgi:signal transduction histidine kinase
LVYAVLFSLIAAVALLSVYKVAERQIKDQIDTRLSLETNILLENYKKRAVKGLLEEINIYNKKEGHPFYIYALIHKNKLDLSRFIPTDKNTITKQNKTFASIPLGDVVEYVPHRGADEMVRILLTKLPRGYQLLVGAELKETQQLLKQLFKATLIAISVIFALSTLIGSLMARRMLNRINAVTNTADNIIEGDLSHRIPVVNDRNNEFDRLGRSLNRMLDRNEELLHGLREVTNNLAHDLRNPLNRIRHRLESTQLKQFTEEDFSKFTDDTLRDIDGLISTFNSLLSIAQVESGEPRKDWDEFQLNSLLDDLAEIYEVVANEQGLKWQYHVSKPLLIKGNKQLIAQLFTNLLDNAFKYSPRNGTVTLTATQLNSSEIEVIIADNGSGIPVEEYDNVFKRFYRLDSARSTEGNGLGLSLVKAVADLHDAKIQLADNKPGMRVRVIFS